MNKQLEKLIELSTNNPELPIKFCVDSDIISSDDHSWYLANISKIEICEMYFKDEDIYIDDQINDELEYEYDNNPPVTISCEYWIELRKQSLIESGDIKKVIAVYLNN